MIACANRALLKCRILMLEARQCDQDELIKEIYREVKQSVIYSSLDRYICLTIVHPHYLSKLDFDIANELLYTAFTGRSF